MADPQINVIRPKGGFNLPKVSPLVIIISTIILALIAVGSAYLLYKNRDVAIAPTAPAPVPASTTTTISDNFDGSTLNSTTWVNPKGTATGASVIQSGGKLSVNIPQQSSQGHYGTHTRKVFTGDFQVEIDLESISTSDSGSVEIYFSEAGVGPKARVSRYKTPSGERVETEFGAEGLTSVNLPAGTGSVRVKISRVGSTIQTFYKTTGDFILLGSTPSGFAGDGLFELLSVVFEPQFPPTTATFDNFIAQGNLSDAVAPEPGTPQACVISFNVLSTVPTPTPGVTPSPTPTPTTSPTPTPSATPTPVPTPTPTPPPSCGTTCTTNADCQSSMICSSGVCRNPSCITDTDCVCSTPTPTPVALGPTPTPVILEQAGSVAGTWTVSLAGIALVVLGSILVLAL